MSTGDKIKYHILLGLSRAVGILPTWFLYHPLCDFVYFMIYKVARYRVRVVRQNLAECFPEKPEPERREIEKKFYRHLAEVFIDTVDIVNIRQDEIRKRIKFIDVEQHEKDVEGKNWIAALAHYGSWEYFPVYQFYTYHRIAGVYRPVKSAPLNRFYKYSRSRFGMDPVSMKVLLRYIVENVRDDKRNIALGMIADQSAKSTDHVMWYDFLNHKTIFYSGIERIATKFGMPVYFVEIRKEKRVRYTATFVMIYDGKEKVKEGEITERYVRRLEEQIRREPQYWMWSHRRFKYQFREGIDHAYR